MRRKSYLRRILSLTVFLVILVTNLYPSYLAADSFGQLRNKLHNAGIFIGCCLFFDVGLQLFDKLIGRRIVFCKYDGCLDNLTSHRVGCTRNGTLKHRRVLLSERFQSRKVLYGNRYALITSSFLPTYQK